LEQASSLFEFDIPTLDEMMALLGLAERDTHGLPDGLPDGLPEASGPDFSGSSHQLQ
jgi:hypothetical protein